jgi:hypothetical protein
VELPAAPVPPAEPIPELPAELAHRSAKKDTQGMHFDRCVRWLKLSGLIREKGNTYFLAFKKLLEYDLWYRAKEDAPFFFVAKDYGDPIALIAEQAGVAKDHLLKRTLPAIKNDGLIDYWIENGQYQFKPNWDALFEIYRMKAYAIPYKESGLKDLPDNFTGIIRPTPFHHLRIENGQALPWNGTGAALESALQETEPEDCEDDMEPIALALRSLKPAMEEKEILFCQGKREETETALKLLQEMPAEKRNRIENEAAYMLELVRRGPKTPQGFITPQEVKELEEKRKRRAEFFQEFKAAKCTYFVRDGNEYEITYVDGEQGFVILKEGTQLLVHFDKCMDMSYFK